MSAVIRPARLEDAAAMAQIYDYYVRETCVTFENDAPDAAEMARRIVEVTRIYPWLVYEQDGKVIGYAYAHRYRERAAFDWACESSVYVDRSEHRKGIGSALYDALFKALALMGIKIVYAAISGTNEISIKMHASSGFTDLARFRNTGFKLGIWHDTVWMERELGERRTAPAPVVPFRTLDPRLLPDCCGISTDTNE